jgi:acetyl-CoA acetyltransferase
MQRNIDQGDRPPMSIRGKAYIAGIYEHPTRLAKDISLAQIHAQVAKGALEDAGLTKDDVDGYFCAGDAPGLGPMSMVEYMGLKPRHVDSTDTGGSSYVIHVGRAALARRHADAGRTVRVPLRADGGEHVRHVRNAPHVRVRHDR